MRRVSIALPSVAVFASITVLAACAARTPLQQTNAASAASIDSIATRVVELELQRITSLATTPMLAASQSGADAQIAALHDRLRARPDYVSAERIVAQRVISALDARQANLTSRIQQMRLVYLEIHPMVRQAMEEKRILDQRRTEIQNKDAPRGAGA
jgi:phage I-like protein